MKARFVALALAALLGSVSQAAPAPLTPQDENSLVGKQPPELIRSEGAWLNWKGDLSLESLRGHVLWLEFSFVR